MERHESELSRELREFSSWVDWMKANLGSGGVDLPSEETCVLIAASSVRLADRIRRMTGHLPGPLRDPLIQASILHQCWKRQASLRIKRRTIAGPPELPTVEGVEFVRKCSASDFMLEGSDGHRYIVSFPSSHGDMTLATQVLCLEFARRMGLTVGMPSFVFVNRSIAARAGVLCDCRTGCLSRDGFCPSSSVLCSLGMRRIEVLEVGGTGKPVLPLSAKAQQQTIGWLVFNVLILNSIPGVPAFRNVQGRADPIFCDFRHCLMDSDWLRFINATTTEQISSVPWVANVRSHEQLETWIKRAVDVDIQQLCEIVVKLPAQWYGNTPTFIAAVAGKLSERIRDLREIIHHLEVSGYFPNIRMAPARAGQFPVTLTSPKHKLRAV